MSLSFSLSRSISLECDCSTLSRTGPNTSISKKYIVAPYEADPQLAYLESHSLVDGIITEDSDLLIFGCRNVLFKLDSEGNCVHVSKANLTRCREFNFSGWGEREFRWMAIFSGCDYLNRIAGVGLKKAYALVRKWGSVEKVCLPSLSSSLVSFSLF